ncbi:MAG: NAD(P)-dependent glycerol-3-phosphate dehydrogenase [Bifidobacteriaceae bacterium]|jgi:glycerol-3-phosphate dehydrogenase (NAD(P)+)|nr:NAD(P)-dependent glycerol-3-phosphate dehydrogenase [Bifidobacteriaceae bacterium]
MNAKSRVAVLGAGAWGTVFAQICSDAGSNVSLLTRDRELAHAIGAGENPRNYPGVALPPIAASVDPAQVLEGADFVAVAVAAQQAGRFLASLAELIPPHALVVSLIKGIELGTGRRMSEVFAEAAQLPPERIAAVSGPNLAGELVQRQPGATVVACADESQARRLAAVIATPYFRPYVNPDLVGVEICGAMKNIIAVAVGAAQGMGLGLNSCATFLARGLAETTRLGLALGADVETFAGMAGLADLTATCLSPLSRNHQVGENLGRGMAVADAVAAAKGTAEAVQSCLALQALAREHGVEVPITDAVVEVLHHGVPAAEMGAVLLSRPFRSEGSRYEVWSDS